MAYRGVGERGSQLLGRRDANTAAVEFEHLPLTCRLVAAGRDATHQVHSPHRRKRVPVESKPSHQLASPARHSADEGGVLRCLWRTRERRCLKSLWHKRETRCLRACETQMERRCLKAWETQGEDTVSEPVKRKGNALS